MQAVIDEVTPVEAAVPEVVEAVVEDTEVVAEKVEAVVEASADSVDQEAAVEKVLEAIAQ